MPACFRSSNQTGIVKTILTSLLALAVVVMSSFAQSGTYIDVIGRFARAMPMVFKYFDDNRLTLAGQGDSYNGAQAQVILKDFSATMA